MKKRLICLLLVLCLCLSVSAGTAVCATLRTPPVVKIPITSGGVRDDLSGTIGGGRMTVTPIGDITLPGTDVNIGTRFTGDYDTTVLPKDLVNQLPGKNSLTVDGQNGTLAMNADVLNALEDAPLDIIFKNDADSRADATPAQKKALESIGAAAAADVGLRQNGSDVDLGDLKIDIGNLKLGNINADGLNIGIAMEDGLNFENDLPLLVISPRLSREQKARLIGGAKGLYIAPDGSTQETPLFSNSLGELSLLTPHLSLYAIVPAECQHDAACPVASFRDLVADAWYHDGVHACAVLGLMQGVGDRSFQPDGVLTRAQFVTMLWRLAGEAGVNGDEIHDFSDVGTGGYYAAAVQWAVANSIAAGTSATTFSPNAPITREQMAAMLFRCAVYDGLTAVALSENLSSFPDVQQLSGWAMSAMQWAVGAGIITGTPDGALAPQKNATRAQAAAMLARYLRN